MKLEFKFSIQLTRTPKPVEEEFEHRDTETLAERAEPQRVGFDIPTTGDDRTKLGIT